MTYEKKEPINLQKWNIVKETLQKELKELTFKTWVKPIRFINCIDGTIYLEHYCHFNAYIFETRYLDLTLRIVKELTGVECQIKNLYEEIAI